MPENDEKNTEEIREEKKAGFFKKIWYSITNFEKYPEMSAQGVASSIKYLIGLMAIFTIIVCSTMLYQFNELLDKGIKYVENELPEISYSNGILDVKSEETIIIDDLESIVDKIIIDTTVENEEEIDKYINSISTEKSGLIILKDKALVKSSAVASANTYSYAEVIDAVGIQGNSLTKQDIVDYFTGAAKIKIYIAFFAVMFVYIFMVYIMSVLVDTLVLSLLGNITALIAKLRIRFSAVYNMAVYALTLSIILNALYIAVRMLTGFEIKYFQIMYTSIAYIYLVAAIFIIKADFVKKQGELMRIIEEQEVVKQELEEQERENQEKKEKNEESNDNKNDTDKNDKEDNQQEPQGSGA